MARTSYTCSLAEGCLHYPAWGVGDFEAAWPADHPAGVTTAMRSSP